MINSGHQVIQQESSLPSLVTRMTGYRENILFMNLSGKTNSKKTERGNSVIPAFAGITEQVLCTRLLFYRVCNSGEFPFPTFANASFTTWRTSTRHQRPFGLFVSQLQLPAFDSPIIFSIMVDRPCSTASFSRSPAV